MTAERSGVRARPLRAPKDPSAGRDRVAAAIAALPTIALTMSVLALATSLVREADLTPFASIGSLTRFLSDGPTQAGREGGIGPMIVATAWVLAIALAAAVPVGLAAAIGLAELWPARGLAARALRAALDTLAALPSIVVGLFGMAFFCEALGLGWSVLAGGLTVATMILPLLTRLAEEGLRATPRELRAAGAALGLSRAVVVTRLVLPAAAPSLGAGLLLATGRVLAESAALLFTAGGSIRAPEGPLESGRVLALHVYHLATEVPGGMGRSCATALVLVGIGLASGGLARALPRLVARQLTRGARAG